MAPIRRYLRITKYSVLECRIYVDNPALAQSWLLNPRDPVLPRVIETVRPLVLPKLEEERERERSRKKGAKKRNIKDVVTADEFEVSIFLTETDTRHSLLYKRKHFRDKTQTKLTSNSTKLVGASQEAPIDVDSGSLLQAHDGEADAIPGLRRENSDEDDVVALENIPSVDDAGAADAIDEARPASKRSKRGRPRRSGAPSEEELGGADPEAIEADSPPDELFVDSDFSIGSEDADDGPPPPKRRREEEPEQGDDKKKLAMDISYDGFAIYGRVLCLVVKRRGGPSLGAPLGGTRSQAGGSQQLGGQASMENWITSTQLPAAEAGDDADGT